MSTTNIDLHARFADLGSELKHKLDLLARDLRGIGRLVVAFSGGVDSSFLLAMARYTLAPANVLAIMNVSAIHPRIDVTQARSLAAGLGVEMLEVAGKELANPLFTANPADRCYHCKKEIFSALMALAGQKGFAGVASGANVDDASDYRPGAAAEKELGIRRPLVEAGLNKAEIRAASRALGLATADKPSAACLASRVPYGQAITAAKLQRIEQAEAFLRKLGLSQYRVRDHETIARIEVPAEELPKIVQSRRVIVERLKALGYAYVTVDLQGFRSGSMNETL